MSAATDLHLPPATEVTEWDRVAYGHPANAWPEPWHGWWTPQGSFTREAGTTRFTLRRGAVTVEILSEGGRYAATLISANGTRRPLGEADTEDALAETISVVDHYVGLELILAGVPLAAVSPVTWGPRVTIIRPDGWYANVSCGEGLDGDTVWMIQTRRGIATIVRSVREMAAEVARLYAAA